MPKKWPRNGWCACVIVWFKHKLGKPHVQWILWKLQCILNTPDQWEFEPFFRVHCFLRTIQQENDQFSAHSQRMSCHDFNKNPDNVHVISVEDYLIGHVFSIQWVVMIILHADHKIGLNNTTCSVEVWHYGARLIFNKCHMISCTDMDLLRSTPYTDLKMISLLPKWPTNMQ